MDKRAITPLMISFLLISFAVAGGVTFMNFGKAQVEEAAQCPIEINMKLATIGGKEDICYNGKEVKFTLENGANIKVEGVLVNIVGSEKAETIDLKNVVMEKNGMGVGKAAFVDPTVRQVKITPKIKLQGNEQVCNELALVVENVRKC
jgi:predicted secreted protein